MTKSRHEWAQITDKIIEQLRAEMARTRVGYHTLLKSVPAAPKGLNGGTVSRWLNDGQKLARAEHLAFVLETYAATPTDAVIDNTPERQALVVAEVARTGVNSKALHEILLAQGDDILTPSTITNWMQGAIVKMPKAHWDRVMEIYAGLPDHKTPITRAHRVALAAEIERTDTVSAAILLDHPDKPAALTIHVAQALLAGKLNEIALDHWNFIIARLGSLPDAPMAEITPQHRQRLADELTRAGLSIAKLARRIRDGKQAKYTPRFLGDVLSGHRTSIRAETWSEIMDTLQDVSVKPRQGNARRAGRITITPAMRKELLSQLDRTNAQITTILRKAPEAMEHLSPAILTAWKTGRTATVSKAGWDYVLGALRELPDKVSSAHSAKRPNPSPTGRHDHIPITPETLERLHKERKRTGVGAAKLMREARSAPNGLNEYMIGAWFRGQTKTALAEHLQWVLREYASRKTI